MHSENDCGQGMPGLLYIYAAACILMQLVLGWVVGAGGDILQTSYSRRSRCNCRTWDTSFEGLSGFSPWSRVVDIPTGPAPNWSGDSENRRHHELESVPALRVPDRPVDRRQVEGLEGRLDRRVAVPGRGGLLGGDSGVTPVAAVAADPAEACLALIFAETTRVGGPLAGGSPSADEASRTNRRR